MKKKYKSAQRLLGYHVYFNTIRDSNGQTHSKRKSVLDQLDGEDSQ